MSTQRMCDTCFEIIEVTPPTEVANDRYEVRGPDGNVKDYHDMCIGKSIDGAMRGLYESSPATGLTVLKRSTYDA